MSASRKKNLAASVRQRLLLVSQKREEPFDLILVRYGIERLLYRLSQSAYANHFLLQGAMLFRVWTHSNHRPTRDVDLLGFGPAKTDELEQIFRELCVLPVEPDGLVFQPTTVKAEPIRGDAIYGGIRVTLKVCLENAQIPLHSDIGFGDAVTPSPDEIEFPALLDFPVPRLRSYPTYTIVAEKLGAMVLLGETNSRMKDFYDLWFMSQRFDFDGRTLVEAIRATFVRRKTAIPEETPVAFTDTFLTIKAVQWNAFIRRSKLSEINIVQAMCTVRTFAGPPLLAASQRTDFFQNWSPNGPWYSIA